MEDSKFSVISDVNLHHNVFLHNRVPQAKKTLDFLIAKSRGNVCSCRGPSLFAAL